MNHSLFINAAKQSFQPNWVMLSVATLLYSVLISLTNYAVVGIILTGPLMYGYFAMLRESVYTSNVNFETLFSGFNRFVETMIAGLLYSLAISFGLLFLIVPGIIVSLGFSMTFFIMAENPNISGVDALKKSWDMTNGYKADLFVFFLRFIGWCLLSILTCGIGFFALQPYITLAQYHYYNELKMRSSATPPPFN